MPERLLVGVLGNRNAGKSYTWNALFGEIVRTGKSPRHLQLKPNECVETFLVSGSFEERGKYAGDVLDNQDCRIVLCSIQYRDDAVKTLNYFIENNFFLCIHWLNPGYSGDVAGWDHLGLVNQILSSPSLLAMRNGRGSVDVRIQEMREFIYGWATYRGLIVSC